MSTLSKITSSSSFKELQANVRLQWLILAVFSILLLSLSDTLLSPLAEKKAEVQQQHSYLNRLSNLEETNIDEKNIDKINDSLSKQLKHYSTASSLSNAEARALESVERALRKSIQRIRLNLIGSEAINMGNQTFWNVRIDVSGKIKNQEVISFLNKIDYKKQDWRISSVQYSPKSTGSLSIVIDVLYMESKDE
ncbi:hypothetical protein J3L16_00440 [Alteromonas sp. 5E99-2]|uniref:hypothetical protein n=1 Tax=Alteromonas sp. 5E99-2 TaxID=2817683 RepID=UPI001A9A0E32|nr:hypothetical protein [Alteromonas sp. 5E99-2]MBO1254145.1 hypothetical protein [Alteromonas sp. 5E99-2]